MIPLRPPAHIHCLGIGGFGINPIARVMHQMGFRVSGCDMNESALVAPLRELGVEIAIGHDPAHIEQLAPAALLISSAVTPDNPEVQAAHRLGIPIHKRADILGALMADRIGIAIAGTHGKTTTTAMLAHTLAACGRDPTFIIGGVARDLGTNARAGQGSAFVIEADEYDRMFMGLRPRVIVLTSLEMDHPDMFADLADARALFTEFVGLLPDDGLLIGCLDDPEVAALLAARSGQGRPTLTYGIGQGDWSAVDVDGGGNFVARHGPDRFPAALGVPGLHNTRNALAALAAAAGQGIEPGEALRALGTFSGTGRRFEVRGEAQGVTVIDDYAHHPTAIRATLQAARARYGQRPIRAVWQPHTYRRTRALLDEFAACFDQADHVIITDVYRSRDVEDYGVRVQDVLDRMDHPDARHIGALDAVTEHLAAHVRPGDVVIIMSAGDATRIGGDLLRALNAVPLT